MAMMEVVMVVVDWLPVMGPIMGAEKEGVVQQAVAVEKVEEAVAEDWLQVAVVEEHIQQAVALEAVAEAVAEAVGEAVGEVVVVGHLETLSVFNCVNISAVVWQARGMNHVAGPW
jgi:hypothetical protein